MKYKMMTLEGSLVGLVYLLIFYLISYMVVRARYRQDPVMRQLFFRGLTLKFIGGLGFALIYQFYYGYGDTFRYFTNADTLVGIFFDDPARYFELIGQANVASRDLNDVYGVTDTFDTQSSYLVTKIASVIGILTGHFFLATTFAFTFLSYIGIWGLFRASYRQFPVYRKYLAMAVLYIPSVFFWGSSLMKDTVVMGFLGLVVYLVYRAFILKEFNPFFFILIGVGFYVLLSIKTYVILSFLPSMVLWVVLTNVKQIQNRNVRQLIKPLSLIVIVAVIGVGLPLLSSSSERYNLDSTLETAETTANYIYRVSVAKDGSAYSLGEISYTPLGLLRIFPQAVNVSLFRPYLWEVRNPVMLLAALEGTAFLVLTLFLFFKVGFLSFFRSVGSQPFLVASLIFSVIFAFAVGVSTFNFGSLVRYKIPCLCFYGIVLAISYGQYRTKKGCPLPDRPAEVVAQRRVVP